MPPKSILKIKSNVQEPCKSWVFVIKSETLQGTESTNETADIETIRHPRTKESAVFLFSQNNVLHEILTFCEEKRSWFIDESVKSDGSLRLSTPIDPIFLVLPYLKQYCNSQALPLDQLLHDEEYPATERLLKCDSLKYLSSVADKKGTDDIVGYKYNEEKTLVWLKKKTENVKSVLKKKNIHLTSDATSSAFKKVGEEPLNDSVYLHYAFGIVSEYLSDELSTELRNHLNLPETLQPVLKRKSEANSMHDMKKVKTDEISPTKKVATLAMKLSKATPQRSKAKPQKKSANTKNIASYFQKS